MTNSEPDQSFLKRIKDRRRTIRSFVDALEPKGIRLTNLNIVCSAIATLLTATPAVLGKKLTDVLGSSANPVTWQVLFAGAAFFSLIATVAANVYKSNDMASRLAKAQACGAKLEGLETLLELGQISLKEAATQYTKLISEISFISLEKGRSRRARASPDWVKGEITEPRQNQVVGDVFSASGWVEGTDAGLHIWLAVEIKGLIWPKEREVRIEDDGFLKETVVEEGATESFSLSMFVADNKANKKIRAWLDKGDQTGDYSELRRLPGMRRIARVEGLRRTSATLADQAPSRAT